MIWFGVIIIIIIIGYLINRLDRKFKTKYEDKFNPSEWNIPASIEAPKPRQIESADAYEKKDSMLSNAEKLLFDGLQAAVAGEYVLLAKIAVTDVIGIKTSAGVYPINSLTGKQFLFVLCEKNTFAVLCAVELSEKNQTNSASPINSSALIAICNSVQLPLLSIERQFKYDALQLRAQVFTAIGAADLAIPKVEKQTDIPKNIELDKSIAEVKTLNPCPKCSAPMVKRKTKTAQLWVCIRYPECRGVVAAS